MGKTDLSVELSGLAEALRLLEMSFNASGSGSRATAAAWLVKNGYETGGVSQVSRKVAHILKGYVRGIRPNFASRGGIWSVEEGAKMASLLNRYLDECHTFKLSMPSKNGESIELKIVPVDKT